MKSNYLKELHIRHESEKEWNIKEFLKKFKPNLGLTLILIST